jgi:putative ABC transport system permease protein
VVFTGFRQHSRNIADVQPNFFHVIGVQPAIGGFAADDFAGPAPRVAPRIITNEVFRSQFGGDPGAIGRVVVVDPSSGSGYRIVGVMPRGFVFPANRFSVGYLTPLIGGPSSTFNQIIAKLPSGVTARELETRVIGARTTFDGSRQSRDGSPNLPIDQVRVEPLGRALGAASRPLFLALLAAAALLVTIAALNASSLMAARSVDRVRELAVRRALGATSVDIGRLLFMEAALLVGSGTILGLMIAAPLLRFTAGLLPEDLALFRSAAIDWRVAAFGAAVTAVLAILVTVWPFRLAIAGGVTPGHERSVTGQARSRGWRLVVTAQVGVALVLTVGGSLLVGSLLSVYAQTPAINTHSVLSIPVQFLGMTGKVGREAPERATRVEALLDRVRTVPGVDAVALTGYDLLEHAYQGASFAAPTTALLPVKATVMHAVTADFYRVIQPHVVAGRLPTDLELAHNDPVLVVSQLVASRFWPNATALGQTLTDPGRRDKTAMTFTVVGVVKDVRWAAWDEEALGTVYGPYALLARQTNSAVLIHTTANRSRVTAEALRVMGETDALLRIGRVMPLEDLFVDSVRPRRFQAWLFGAFAFASLFVAGLGILGQLAMSTARRTREVGIRMACGATRGSIARLILREQLVPVAAGLIAGGLGAAWAVQFVKSYLYQITSSDPRVWIAATSLILLTAAIGAMIPALRASRTDPIQSLRGE